MCLDLSTYGSLGHPVLSKSIHEFIPSEPFEVGKFKTAAGAEKIVQFLIQGWPDITSQRAPQLAQILTEARKWEKCSNT